MFSDDLGCELDGQGRPGTAGEAALKLVKFFFSCLNSGQPTAQSPGRTGPLAFLCKLSKLSAVPALLSTLALLGHTAARSCHQALWPAGLEDTLHPRSHEP